MNLSVTTWLVCGLAVLFLVMTARVIQLRWARRVSLGDGGDADLRRAVRGHGNLIESAPLFALLVLLGEAQGAPLWAISPLAAAFFIGRAMHALCFGFLKANMPLRSGGMLFTLVPMTLMVVVDLVVLL